MLDVLAKHGFEPFRDTGGTIRLRNCPFHQLAAEHPAVVCGMNLALVDGVITGLGADRDAPDARAAAGLLLRGHQHRQSGIRRRYGRRTTGAPRPRS